VTPLTHTLVLRHTSLGLLPSSSPLEWHASSLRVHAATYFTAHHSHSREWVHHTTIDVTNPTPHTTPHHTTLHCTATGVRTREKECSCGCGRSGTWWFTTDRDSLGQCLLHVDMNMGHPNCQCNICFGLI
jgi:hypothetical protein